MYHQILDIFKTYRIMDKMQQAQKKGDVKQVHVLIFNQQKIISRNVIQIEGLVSTVNYLKIPKQKKSLKLSYQYLYIMAITIGNLYGLTVHCLANNILFKFNFSSIHKKIKKTNTHSYNIPLPVCAKWSIICIDLKSYIPYSEMPQILCFQIQDIQLNASLKVRNIFASNNYYEINSLPKQMTFPLGMDEVYYDKYGYLLMSQNQNNQKHEQLDNPKKIKENPIKIKKELQEIKECEEEIPLPKTQVPLPVQPKIHTQKQFEMTLQYINGKVQTFIANPFAFSIGKLLILQKGTIVETPTMISMICERGDKILLGHKQGQISLYSKLFMLQGYLKTGLQEIIDGDMMQNWYVVIGKDNLSRTVLMIIEGEKLLFRKVCNFEIKCLKSIKNLLVTCGKQAIVIWQKSKLKSKDVNFKPNALFLGQHARNNIFNDIEWMPSYKRILIASSKGNVYMVDSDKKEIVAALKIHQESVEALMADPEGQYVLTSGNQGKLKLWKPNFTQLLMEIPIQNRVIRLCYSKSNKQVFALHLNHTLGVLNIEQKKYKFLSRCHTERIIQVCYHIPTKRLVSISEDLLIKIWKLIQKEDTYSLQQLYEFRILDQHITSMNVHPIKNIFAVGFDQGTIRIFNIFQLIVQEQFEYHKARINNLEFDQGDVMVAADQSGIVSISYQFKKVRCLQFQNWELIKVGINSEIEVVYVQLQKQIQLYSLKTIELVSLISCQSQIMTSVLVRSSVFLFTYPSTLLHYKQTQSRYQLIKQFKYLHQNQKNLNGSMLISDNMLFIFSIVEKLRVTQFGAIEGTIIHVPEAVGGLTLSRDQLNLLFTWGRQNSTICIYKFKGQLRSNRKQVQTFLNKPQQPAHLQINNLHKKISQSGQNEVKIFKVQQQPKQIKSIYHEIQNMCNQPENFQEGKQDQQINVQRMEITQRLLGYSIPIGYNGIPFKFPWTKPFVVLPCQQGLIFNKLNRPIQQQIHHSNPITWITLSPSQQYIGLCTVNQVEILSVRSIILLKKIKITAISIHWSRCENYLLILTKDMISVVEVHSTRNVVSSKIELVQALQWNRLGYASMEWAIATNCKIQFWRLTSERTLEYQDVQMEMNTVHKYGDFTCLHFISFFNKVYLFVGTKKGTLIIIDVRSANLSLIVATVIQGTITHITHNPSRLIILSSNINVYYWEGQFIDIQTLITILETKPKILTIDSLPIGVSEGSQTEEEIMVLGKSGVLWFVDFQKETTIKVLCAHQFGKLVTDAVYINNPHNLQQNTLITLGSDCSIKLTSINSLQLKCQLQTPQSIPLTCCVLGQLSLLVIGHMDSVIRFFSLVSLQMIGATKLTSGVTCIKEVGKFNVLVGNQEGQVWMAYIPQNFEHKLSGNFNIEIVKIVEKVDGPINTIKTCPFNDLECWLLTTKTGKVNVWNRKNIKRSQNLDFLSRIYELQYYLIDNCKLNSRLREKQSLTWTEKAMADFLTKKSMILVCSSSLDRFYLRNYIQHVNVKEIEWNIIPESIQVFKDSVICGDVSILNQLEGVVRVYDWQTGLEKDRITVGSQRINFVKLWLQSQQGKYNKFSNYNTYEAKLLIGHSNQIRLLKMK